MTTELRYTRVLKTWQESSDVFSFELEPPVGGNFHFEPGQFNMLYVHGVGECAISISGDPGLTHSVVHTVRIVGSVTRKLCELQPGDELGIRGPFGVGWPLELAKGKDLLFVAGGIGLVPVRPAILKALRHRRDYGKISLIYGARTPRDLLFGPEVERWQRESGVQVFLTVDQPDDGWQGHVGFVNRLFSMTGVEPSKTEAMLCGPEMMMRVSAGDLLRLDLPPSSIHLSIERNMKCGFGLCGHCQLGPVFVCKDGPVFNWDRVGRYLAVREL
jgi:NAD(P)H-flavin reductase